MKTELDISDRASVAATVAPEDLRCGDYVAVLSEILEFPSWCWLDLPSHPVVEPVRVRMLPGDEGLPLKIKAICLPFVFVRTPGKWSRFYDVRGIQFVRVDRHYARCVWKQARKERRRRSRSDV